MEFNKDIYFIISLKDFKISTVTINFDNLTIKTQAMHNFDIKENCNFI